MKRDAGEGFWRSDSTLFLLQGWECIGVEDAPDDHCRYLVVRPIEGTRRTEFREVLVQRKRKRNGYRRPGFNDHLSP